MDIFQLAKTGPLALTAVFGHVVTLISLPFILRIYGPEAFGEYSLILSIGYVLLIASTMKLEVVIPMMKHLTLAGRLTSALLVLSLVIGSAVLPLGLLLHQITGWTPGHAISAVPVYAMIAALVVLCSAVLVMRNWLVRIQALTGVAIIQVVRPVGFALLAIVFGLAWPTAAPSSGLALLSAMVIAMAAAALFGYWAVPKPLRKLIWPTRWHRSWQEIRANAKYLSAVSVSQILDLISLQIPLWVTAALYGATPAGWVALAGRIVFLPAMVVGSSLAPVLNRRLSSAYHAKRALAQDVRMILLGLGFAGFLGFGLIAMSAPWLSDVLFGGKWAGTAPTLRIYCFYGFAYFLGAATAFIPMLMKESTYLVVLNAIRCCGLLLASLAAFLWDFGFETFIAAMAAIEVCVYICGVAYTIHLTQRHDAAITRGEA